MRFLLFDVMPAHDALQQYLDTAAALRPALEAQGGCLFIDRFRDLDDPRWLLSFQIWRDEAALAAWRSDAQHHTAQRLGREHVFDDYRIRVGAVIDGEAPPAGRYVAWVESPQASSRSPLPVSAKRYASIYREGECMHVAGADTLAAAEHAALELSRALNATRSHIGLVERDYGMYSRAEAPQAFPERSR